MDRVRLTRRDALKALAAGGIGSGSLIMSEVIAQDDFPRSDNDLQQKELKTVVAVAETVYPSQVEVTTEFIRSYIDPLSEDRKEPISQSATELNTFTKTRYGALFYDMTVRQRNTVLHSLGVDKAHSRPDGNQPQRIKYHLVNSLLYALFTTPTGSELAGIKNPVGHPGGFATYNEK